MADPDDLYQQFIEVYQSRSNEKDPERVADVTNEFEGLTDAHLQVLISLKSKRAITEDDSNMCKKLEVMLQEERNTWRLAKALVKDQLLTGEGIEQETSLTSNRMDDSVEKSLDRSVSDENGCINVVGNCIEDGLRFSEDQLIGNFYMNDVEVRRMQLVADWLEANEASGLDYRDEEDKVEFYAEGPTAWENTLHNLRNTYNIDIPDLDITMNPDNGLELCPAMDPDGPIRTKKSLAHQDKEIELRLYKHLFRFVRAGKLDEGQELAQRVGYHWLSAILEGWLPYSDPNLDQENLGEIAIHQPNEIRPVTGNKKRSVWKLTCFKSAKIQGLNSCEKAVLGALGGNLKSVLPVCHTWADQLWARLKCSIDVKIEKALRDPHLVAKENLELVELPQEFYDNYQNFADIFESMKDYKIVSPHKEATIHQTIQKYLILNDVDNLLNQLAEWSTSLDYDFIEGAISPHFLRCFAHIVLFLRDVKLVDEQDTRSTKILERYIKLLTKQKLIESVAFYSRYLPKENQTLSFARLLATICDREERRHCLRVAKDSFLDVDEITQTVVELIRNERLATNSTAPSLIDTKTSAFDKRKIDALDYLLMLDIKNYMAILYHGNMLLRHFALLKKMDAVKETFLKLPVSLSLSVENQWKVHTNSDITTSLRNNLRELDGFRALLETHEELGLWSEWHHKKPEEPKKPANLSKFCDNVNYEQRMKQYQQDLSVWRGMREVRTDTLVDKVNKLFYFEGGWMIDLPIEDDNDLRQNNNRIDQLQELRKHFVPHLVTIQFNILQLTSRYEDCLTVSHILADENLKLYDEFTQTQLRDFLDKISEVTKLIVKSSQG